MKWQNLVSHVLAGLVAFAFLGAGGTKVAGLEMHVQQFAGWGYPGFFVYLTGALELLAAGLLGVPKSRPAGAALAAVVMLGAVGTHALHGELGAIVPPLVLGLMAAGSGALYRN